MIIDERLLHFIWQYRCFHTGSLCTLQGEPVHIIYPGRYNLDGGPDFLEAIIQIGDKRWAGHVEIHTKESHWHVHKHEGDIKYQNVILHVVWNCDIKNRRLPTLSLEGRIPPSLIAKYRKQMEQKLLLPCHYEANVVPEIILIHWRERLMIERLEQKALGVLELLNLLNDDWNQLAFVHLATYLGLPANTEVMKALAQSIDYKIILKNGDANFTIEAILFGVSGLLQDVSIQDYTLALKNEYKYQMHKYGLKDTTSFKWQWLRMRPSSFPTIRIAQLASICTHLFPIMDKILDDPIYFLLALEKIETSSYWESHYTFEKISKKRKKHIGKDLCNRIGSNVIAPLLMAYSLHSGNKDYQEVALELLSKLPAEDNALLKKFAGIFPESHTSSHSQGLIQLYKQYCAKKRCLDCAIGCHILKRKANFDTPVKKSIFEIREEEVQYARA